MQLAHVLQDEVVPIFFVFLIQTDGVVAEFSVLEHLCSTFLYLVSFKKSLKILTEVVNG